MHFHHFQTAFGCQKMCQVWECPFNPLMPDGKKRLHILKQKVSVFGVILAHIFPALSGIQSKCGKMRKKCRPE